MRVTILFLMLVSLFNECSQEKSADEKETLIVENREEGNTLLTRVSTNEGFNRIEVEENSYANYLRNLPLKPKNSLVQYYDGDYKVNRDVYEAVFDLEIGNKNLHQCADAIMRLRGEYLWRSKMFDQIHFNFTNGFRVDYSKWMEGHRIVVDGNKTFWKKAKNPSNTYQDFWNYMEIIFTYAGTLSLEKELISIPIDEMQIGDVFIQGGSPGHAVVVVDMAVNDSGEKEFLLAQSYMPAQELQLLKNPNSQTLSPWYSLDFVETLRTPEWTFQKTDLKRFN